MRNSPFTFLELRSEALVRLRYAGYIKSVDVESFNSIRNTTTPSELSLQINLAIVRNGIVGEERAELRKIRVFLNEH